jgi:integrase
VKTRSTRRGTIQAFRSKTLGIYYRARIALRDGSRVWVDVPEAKRRSETASRNFAAYVQEQEDARGLLYAQRCEVQGVVVVPELETVSAWAARWRDARTAAGLASARDSLAHVTNHIAPALADAPMAAVGKRDLEKLVQRLDDAVQAGTMSWKTAVNVWGTASKMFDDAAHAKRLELRCREDNPAEGVRGPDRGARKAKQFLYPAEVERFVACEGVPLEWRSLVAVAAYTGLRAGELRALRCEDVDLEAGVIHVHRATNRDTGADKGTKSGVARRFAVEPQIVPVLRALIDAAAGDRVFPTMPAVNNLSVTLRRYLWRAGVTRAELFDSQSATRKALTFHDLRATYVTWRAVRGDDAFKLMHAAGHAGLATTTIYVRQADALRAGFGVPFPTLGCLTSGLTEDLTMCNYKCEGRELKPAQGEGASDSPGFSGDAASAVAEATLAKCAEPGEARLTLDTLAEAISRGDVDAATELARLLAGRQPRRGA